LILIKFYLLKLNSFFFKKKKIINKFLLGALLNWGP
jgi:hypothetical protein